MPRRAVGDLGCTYRWNGSHLYVKLAGDSSRQTRLRRPNEGHERRRCTMSTLLASTRDRQILATSPAELDQAQQVVEQLQTRTHANLSIRNDDNLVEVPTELSAVVARILSIVASGGSVTVSSMPEELTTSTAAEQLGVSRPTLMKMISRGEINSHRVGTHTRLLTSDVIEFRRARQERRREAFAKLRELEDEDE